MNKIIVDKDIDGFLVMFPTGEVKLAPTKKDVYTMIKTFTKKEICDKDILFTQVEWRL